MKTITFITAFALTACGSSHSIQDNHSGLMAVSDLQTVSSDVGVNVLQAGRPGSLEFMISLMPDGNLRLLYSGNLTNGSYSNRQAMVVQDGEVKVSAPLDFVGRTGYVAIIPTRTIHSGRIELFFKTAAGQYDSNYGRNYPLILQK